MSVSDSEFDASLFYGSVCKHTINATPELHLRHNCSVCIYTVIIQSGFSLKCSTVLCAPCVWKWELEMMSYFDLETCEIWGKTWLLRLHYDSTEAALYSMSGHVEMTRDHLPRLSLLEVQVKNRKFLFYLAFLSLRRKVTCRIMSTADVLLLFAVSALSNLQVWMV